MTNLNYQRDTQEARRASGNQIYPKFSKYQLCDFRVEYIQLALEHKPLNLGQGFPDYPPPKYVTDALAQVANSDNCLIHQYTRGFVSNRISLILRLT
jgi:hypothetical protein